MIRFIVFFSLLLAVSSAGAAPEIKRIASLSYCHDAMIAKWLQPDQTLLTSQDFGRRIERVLAFQPDVVLVNPFNDPQYKRVLRAQGVSVVELSEPTQLEDVPNHWQEVIDAAALGEEAQRALTQLEALLAHRPSEPRGTFIAYQANQWSWAQHNLVHDVMTLLGYQNLATQKGVLQRMQVEEIVWLQPDVLLMEPPSEYFALAHLNQWHRALPSEIIEMPRALGGCMAQRLPEAMAALAEVVTATALEPAERSE
ncbi:MAG: ABC-type iron chelate uptake system substrate-binding component [Idiomarinaceae bacterium HL-53]|nr:MAG: ABC-type iron chelate uptake system substrate-binding component [Idiomarinaceae bacterium HL-53]CUS49485.1 Periplasmic binding protein [Idiomarinaceae bacterium HL-53]